MSMVFCSPPASLLLLSLTLADVVVLKNGNEIQGEVLSESRDRVVVKFPGGTLELPRKQVDSVRRQPRIEYLLEEGEKQLRRGGHEEAMATFREALRESPSSWKAQEGFVLAQERWASVLQDLGRFEEARTILRSILDAHPAQARATEAVKTLEQAEKEVSIEEQRGREEIARGDLEKGAWRLQRILDRFPARRSSLSRTLGEAILGQGNSSLKASRWAEACRSYVRALTVEPDLVPYLRQQFVVATTRQIEPLLPAGDFTLIEALAGEGLQVDPSCEILRYYHGLALEGLGRRRDAAEEYLTLVDAPRPASIEAAAAELRRNVEEKLSDKGGLFPTASPHSGDVLQGDFRQLATTHFAILHKNQVLAREVAFVAEKEYSRIFHAIASTTHLQTPLTIALYPTRQEYLAAGGPQSWSSGFHRVAHRLGSLSDHRISSYQDHPRLTTGVLPHEIAHALLEHRLNYPDTIPLWANEGFAVLQEPEYFHRHHRAAISRESARRTLIPVKDLLVRDEYPEDRVHLFYAQSFSIVEFLVSLEGMNTFVNFLKALASDGAGLEGNLHRFYRIAGATALENRWLGWFELGGSRKSES